MKPRKLGEILIELGLLDDKGLQSALEVQRREGGTLGRVVQHLGLADEMAVTNAIADWFDFECLDAPVMAPETAKLLPIELCQKRMIAPLGLERGELRLAMADPLDVPTIQDVEFMTNLRVVPVVAPESSIRRALDRLLLVGQAGAAANGIL
ncbi:MAG: hypothetical protein ACREJG_12795, partial [Candidatus Rokuibacteriota bacterium]